MNNITIDVVMDYIIIMLSNDSNGQELTNTELSILLDIVRDTRMPEYEFFRSRDLPMVSGRINLSRPIEQEMSDMCELLNHRIKYQPERIPKLLKRKNGNKTRFCI